MRTWFHTLVPGRRRVLFAACGVLAGLVAACSDSTDPGGGGGNGGNGDIEIVFSPLSTNPQLTIGSSLEFRVTVTGAPATVVWTRGGSDVGNGETYLYVAAAVGKDTVSAAVSAGSENRAQTWIITVEPDESELPPVVTGVSVEADRQKPATVVVKWRRVTEAPYEIVDYLVAMSYGGPVTSGTWDQALLLATVRDTSETFYQQTFDESDGLEPGAVAWFAVRARDEKGQMSPIREEFSLRITYGWHLDVTVRDDAGEPLQSVIFYDDNTPFETTSDADGFARLGPFPSNYTVMVRTVSDHFDIESEPQAVADGDTLVSLELVLPARYFLEHVSCGASDPTDFLALLRHVTLTDDVLGASKGYRLYRWERYPLAVWIGEPAVPHQLGWDVRSLAADALPIWNETLNRENTGEYEDYFVAAEDSLSADIVIAFVPLPETYNGITEMLVPAGDLGMKIPQKMVVKIDSALGTDSQSPQEIWITEVALHELGHTLGINGHICIAPVGNLMDFGGAIGSITTSGAAAAISADEWRVVRAIRHIPQGTNMSLYDPAP